MTSSSSLTGPNLRCSTRAERTLYRGMRAEHRSVPLIGDANEVQQTFELPAADYQRIRARAVSLVIDYSLTVRAVVAEHKMPAMGGELRSPEIGVCRSDADSSASFIRCRQIGARPNCYSATLYGRTVNTIRPCSPVVRTTGPSSLRRSTSSVSRAWR